MNDTLLESFDDGLLTLTLNRPDSRNALNAQLVQQLLNSVGRAATDSRVRAILLTGAGKTFCAGGDVKDMARGSETRSFDERVRSLRAGMEVARLLHQMPKPTIAVIRGAAAGAGLSLALACDLRIATCESKLTTAFAKVGLSGDYGGTYFLERLVGSGRARELYLLSPVLTANEAMNIGLVTRVVADAEVDEYARELARQLANGPSVALGYIKENINLAQEASLHSVLDAEALRHIRCTQTNDHKEAALAFVEKRPAVFQGN